MTSNRNRAGGRATRYKLDGPRIDSWWGGTRPDRPWGPFSLLYNGHRVSFLGVKRPGCAVDHPPASSAKVKEKIELHLHYPPGPSWPFKGWTSWSHPELCHSTTLYLTTTRDVSQWIRPKRPTREAKHSCSSFICTVHPIYVQVPSLDISRNKKVMRPISHLPHVCSRCPASFCTLTVCGEESHHETLAM